MNIYDQMREWLLECYDDEYDQEIIHELTDDQLIKTVNREFSGGMKQFILCCSELT